MNHSIFDYIARDDDAPKIAGRKALALASKRIEEHFGDFLAKTANDDTKQRLELIREDFDAVVSAVCKETGHEDVGGLIRTLWNDRIARISGDNPFAKKDDDNDDDDDDKCDCKGDEECAKCRKKDKDDDDDDNDKGNPFAKKDSRTASTHEARKPKLCPYHDEVTNISLAAGDPTAGYNAMNSHAWSVKHCKGDEYEGNKCNFKPDMVTQSYWDDKAEKAEERKRERAEQAETEQAVEPNLEEQVQDTEQVEPVAEDNVVDLPVDEGGEVAGEVGLPQEDLMAVAASVKRFVPLGRVAADSGCGRCGESGVKPGKKCPVCGYEGGQEEDPAWGGKEKDSRVAKIAFNPTHEPPSGGTVVRGIPNHCVKCPRCGDRNGVPGLVCGACGDEIPDDKSPDIAKDSRVADLAPMTQSGIAAEVQSLETQGVSPEKALQMVADKHGLTEQQIMEFASKPSPLDSHVAEALEHQDITKNTFPKTDRSNERPKAPPDTEMDGTPHPTERVDIYPDIDDPDRANHPENTDPEDVGNVTERQDVTKDTEFSNKYPNRWASADAAIAEYNK